MVKTSRLRISSGFPPERGGFSLVEILVVASIIAILVGLVVPAVSGMVKKAQTVRCSNNMRQWGIALNLYLGDNNGAVPYEGNEENPNWVQVRSANNERAWYNVLPSYVDMPPLKDFSAGASARRLYSGRGECGILQSPAAVWLGNEASQAGPRFSYAYNSKLFGGSAPADIRVSMLSGDSSLPANNINRRVVSPSSVPFLLDARASTKEPKAVSGMNEDIGTALAYTRRFINRHAGGVGKIVFFDGSVRSFKPKEIMDNNGRNIRTSPVIWNPWNPDEP